MSTPSRSQSASELAAPRVTAVAHGALDLAIVVVSWNVRELLAGCLESLHDALGRLAGCSAGVWVVDNASADGSADMVCQRFPAVHLMRNATNRGFAAANNQALREIGFDSRPPAAPDRLPRFVILLNPDTTVGGGALAAWLAAAEEHPHAGVVGPSLRYADGRFQHAAFHFPTLAQVALDFFPLHHRLLESRINGRYSRRLYAAGRPFPVGHPLGAAMLVRREAILAAGLLDEGYFMYAEEVDWCLRMRQAGWPALCAPVVVVVHHEAQSTRQFREGMFVALWRSRLRLFGRHYGRLTNVAFRAIVRVGLGRMRAQANAAAAAGTLDAAGLSRRLAAIGEVDALLRRPAAELAG